MYPSIDFYPHHLITSDLEPITVEQQLILQIRNLTAEPISFYNDSGKACYEFLPIESAQPIPGLSMLYLVFPLGTGETDFTTEEYFKKIKITLPDTLNCQRVGNDTLVIFPSATTVLEQMDLYEILLEPVITTGRSGIPSLVGTTLFTDDAKISLGFRPLYRITHSLQIEQFELSEDCLISGFQDELNFHYRILGATDGLLTPGDTVLSPQGDSVSCTLYQPTVYALTAACGNTQIDRKLEILPRRASISSFKGKYVKNGDQTRDVTLSILVENTRHAYLNRVGRITVTPGKLMEYKLEKQEADLDYRLSVENEDGLSVSEVEWG